MNIPRGQNKGYRGQSLCIWWSCTRGLGAGENSVRGIVCAFRKRWIGGRKWEQECNKICRFESSGLEEYEDRGGGWTRFSGVVRKEEQGMRRW